MNIKLKRLTPAEEVLHAFAWHRVCKWHNRYPLVLLGAFVSYALPVLILDVVNFKDVGNPEHFVGQYFAHIFFILLAFAIVRYGTKHIYCHPWVQDKKFSR